jgi:HK97 gp10 family phage protein
VSEITVEGLAALEQALTQLPEKIERNVIRGALRAGSKVFLQEARRRVPIKTGALRKSIRISVRRTRSGLVAYTKAGDKEAFYAQLVEFGTTAHFIKPSKAKALDVGGSLREIVRHPGSGPKPYMRPAFDIGARPAVLAYAAYIRRRLTKQGLNTLSED